MKKKKKKKKKKKETKKEKKKKETKKKEEEEECCSWRITKFCKASFLVNKPEEEYKFFHRLLAPDLLSQTNPRNKNLKTLISVKMCPFQFKSLMLRVKEGTNHKKPKYLPASTSIYGLFNDAVSRSDCVSNFKW